MGSRPVTHEVNRANRARIRGGNAKGRPVAYLAARGGVDVRLGPLKEVGRGEEFAVEVVASNGIRYGTACSADVDPPARKKEPLRMIEPRGGHRSEGRPDAACGGPDFDRENRVRHR